MKPNGRLLLVVVVAAVAAVLVPALAMSSASGDPPERIGVRPAAETVPDGQILKVIHLTEAGETTDRYLVDPEQRRCVHEIVEGAACPPFAALLVYDDSGVTEISGVTLDIYEMPGTYEEAISGLDPLGGRTLEQVGAREIAGVLTQIVKGEASVGADAGETTVGVAGFIDPSTGLVIREEITDGRSITVVTREFVSPSAEPYGEVDRSQIKTLVEITRAQRLEALGRLPYTAFVLPDGTDGLSLMWVMPSQDGNWCRLEYESASAPGRPAASVELWNLDAYPDYPSDMLRPLGEARIDDDAEVQRASFRVGDTAVQVQVEKACLDVPAVELAAELVPISEVDF